MNKLNKYLVLTVLSLLFFGIITNTRGIQGELTIKTLLQTFDDELQLKVYWIGDVNKNHTFCGSIQYEPRVDHYLETSWLLLVNDTVIGHIGYYQLFNGTDNILTFVNVKFEQYPHNMTFQLQMFSITYNSTTGNTIKTFYDEYSTPFHNQLSMVPEYPSLIFLCGLFIASLIAIAVYGLLQSKNLLP